MLTRRRKRLWEDPEGWDLRIVCRYGLWLVHQEILERNAPEFFKIVMQMAKVGASRDGLHLPFSGQLKSTRPMGVRRTEKTFSLQTSMTIIQPSSEGC